MASQPDTTQWKKGISIALGTYMFWGLFPLYFKLLDGIPAIEVLMHRIVWSCAFTFLLVTALSLWPEITAIFRSFKRLKVFLFSAFLLGLNWLLFIYGIVIDDVLQLSLGYFINPLFNMIFGLLFFKERISGLVKMAIVLVVLGLSLQLLNFSHFPWVAVSVAFIFSLYGAVRKTTKVHAASGLFIESSLLLGPALIYILSINGGMSFDLMTESWRWCLLLIFAGPLTSMPLLTFTMAVQIIPYYLVGFCQYVTPTMLFVLAVFVFDESWTQLDIATFILVWLGVLLSLISSIQQIVKNRRLKNISAR